MEPRNVVTESKDNKKISSYGTMWWKMGRLCRRGETDCKIGVEIKLMSEWRTMGRRGIVEDDFVTTVVSEATTRRGLKQEVKVSWQ